MGFPPHKCKQAMGAAGNVDGAISYIFANEDKPESFWQPTQPTQLAQPVQPAKPVATAASADSVLAKLQQALSASREESSSFGHRMIDWLGSPAPAPPPKLRGDLEVAPPLSERRKHMFTASRFADMAGISPYGRPHALWLVMTGREPADEVFQGNEATHRGQELEPVARRAYELRFAKSAPPCDFVAHPEHIWLGATPDGVIGEDGLLEIKCPMHKAHEEVPLHYMAQVQGQLEIMDRAWCDFVSWQPDRMVVIHVPRSREYWAWLYPLLERFYAHVLSDEPLPAEAKTPAPPPAVENIVTLYDGSPPLVTAKLPVTPAPGAAASEVDSSDQLAATHAPATGAPGRGGGTGQAARAGGVARGTSASISVTDAGPGPGPAASAASAAAAAGATAAAAPAAAAVAAPAAAAVGAVGTDTGTGTATPTAQRVGLKRTAESVGTNSSPPTKKKAGQSTPTTASPATADAQISAASTGMPAQGIETGTAPEAESASDGAKLTRSASVRGEAGRPVDGSASVGASKNGDTTEKIKQGKDGVGRGGRVGSAGRGRGRSRARGGKGKGRGKQQTGGGAKG